MRAETIYALSTVYGKSGIAVIRISGSDALLILRDITKNLPVNITPRKAYYVNLINPQNQELLDKALVIYFKAPNSFTGEDIVELNCHGSKAVLNSVLQCLAQYKNLRLADPGEFSKRAFYNKKMDLTEAEGLADLIDAETSEQQKFALRQMEGNLKNLYSDWRKSLVNILSILEAFIDFPEEDIPENLYKTILDTVFKVKKEIKDHLTDNNVNERLKNGFNVVIAGETNAGKSSLINALVKRTAVIVSDIAGTTRDAVDISMDINGYPVTITDTAGLRKTDDTIEKMGIDIAKEKMEKADIIVHLYDGNAVFKDLSADYHDKSIYVANKEDLLSLEQKNKIIQREHILISAKYSKGTDLIIDKITEIIKNKITPSSTALITRIRYRNALEECLKHLDLFNLDKEIELASEDIRLACRFLGKITGEVAVSEILDNIFSSFCIGK